jgi:hypothetical protein
MYGKYLKILVGKSEVKVKFPCALTEHHAMEAYCGSGSIVPLIL